MAALQSSIGKGLRVPDDVVLLDATFPMSRYFNAFDFAVAASGYNAFHEQIAFGLPSLFVPMPRNTDDQAARAGWAAEHDVALAVDGPGDDRLVGELERLLDAGERESLREACEARLEEQRRRRGGEDASQRSPAASGRARRCASAAASTAGGATRATASARACRSPWR